MKKYKVLTLIIALLVVTSLIMSACSSAVPPTASIRWEDGETLTYNITMLADDESKFTKEHEGVSFPRNYQLTTDKADQIKPDSLKGTLTTKITVQEETITYEWIQRLEETHSLKNKTVKELAEKIDSSMIIEQTSDKITLLSTWESKTVFKKESSQAPVSSYKKINGYYIGKTTSQINNVEVTTDYEGTTAKVNLIENGKTTKNEYKVGATSYIDATQIYLYVRSLDQTKAFQTTATFYVYDPITNKTALMGASLQRDYNTQLNLGDLPYAKVNAMGIATSTGASIGFLYNNPKDTMLSNVSAEGRNKFTSVKMQIGYLVYEFKSYTNEQVEQLKFVKETSN